DAGSTRCDTSNRPGSFKGREVLLVLAMTWATVLFFCPRQVWAFQSHPAPEGLYVHQLAHLVFIIAMTFFVYWLEVNLFTRERGWRYIQVSALLFIIWNIVAVLGHCVEELLPKELFVGDPDWSQRLVAGTNTWAECFYVLKMDHIICVPAVICLFMGIRTLYQNALKHGKPTDG
ncbi:MAG: hypothetical protein V2B18_09235, partial [Pseudomonadota bacterium]